MKIIIASDHGAFSQKNKIAQHLLDDDYEVLDYGTNDSKSVDYPDIAFPVARDVADGVADCGILMCGTGIGVSLAANKVHGIRAAVVNNLDFAVLAKEHNNANIICLSGRFSSLEDNIKFVDAYLNSKFAGDKNTEDGSERHLRRVAKIMSIEQGNYDV